MIKRLREKLEAWMNAVAFAEAGEDKAALEILGRKERKRSLSAEDFMTAITFAEAGLPDTARTFLTPEQPRRRVVPQRAYLQIPGVRIWYGTVPVRA
jgi:hypothetical protein